MDSLYFFRTVDDDLLKDCACQCSDYDFSYSIEGQYRPLTPKGKGTIQLIDALEAWKIENDGLRIRRNINIEYPEVLQGPNGIACAGAEIGICIIWSNPTLSQMGYILPSSIRSCIGQVLYEFSYDFLPGEILGNLTLETIFYIKKASERVLPGEECLANETGMSLGQIDFVAIASANDFMDFPIREVSLTNEPLWWLELNSWEDPTQDPFNEEYVCLYLNSAHPACPKLGDSIKNIDVLVEIISAAYLMIIQKIDGMQLLNRTLTNNDLQAGSIAKIMYYFFDSCDPKPPTESIESMEKGILINVERMLKGEIE